jgi:hypothetical protein
MCLDLLTIVAAGTIPVVLNDCLWEWTLLPSMQALGIDKEIEITPNPTFSSLESLLSCSPWPLQLQCPTLQSLPTIHPYVPSQVSTSPPLLPSVLPGYCLRVHALGFYTITGFFPYTLMPEKQYRGRICQRNAKMTTGCS